MTLLSDESLEFAKDHISRFYDTDFFPKPFEFEALWHCWDEVKKELLSKNIHKMQLSTPTAFPWKKPKGGFRVVHQLDPLDALIYTGLVYEVAECIEKGRIDESERVACAYRIAISDGSYFSAGSGYDIFREKSKELASSHKHVLQTDITDFYNQVYLHRLNNAIEHADSSLKNLADDIETFLTSLNQKASQGLPVGPAPSIVLAEAVLTDVDQFLINLGVKHTRYVDDFRIFSDDQDVLDSVLQRLTLYLYQNHRLTLSTEKTLIHSTEQFIQQLENPYEIEKINVIEEIEILHPYTLETIDVVYLEDEEQSITATINKITEALDGLIKKSPLDLGFGRALLRQARAIKTTALVPQILSNFAFFLPMANNVILYLNDVVEDSVMDQLVGFFADIDETNLLSSELPRIWVEWFLTNHHEFIKHRKIRSFLYQSPNLITQARAAVIEKNISWVRNHKSAILNSSPKDRRALLFACQILPTDEKEPLIKQISNATPFLLDQWVAKWVLNKDRADDIPF